MCTFANPGVAIAPRAAQSDNARPRAPVPPATRPRPRSPDASRSVFPATCLRGVGKLFGFVVGRFTVKNVVVNNFIQNFVNFSEGFSGGFSGRFPKFSYAISYTISYRNSGGISGRILGQKSGQQICAAWRAFRCVATETLCIRAFSGKSTAGKPKTNRSRFVAFDYGNSCVAARVCVWGGVSACVRVRVCS